MSFLAWYSSDGQVIMLGGAVHLTWCQTSCYCGRVMVKGQLLGCEGLHMIGQQLRV